jgi:hypothetical protein
MLRNQAHAPQSAAAAKTLRLLGTSISLLSQSFSLSAIDPARPRHGNATFYASGKRENALLKVNQASP